VKKLIRRLIYAISMSFDVLSYMYADQHGYLKISYIMLFSITCTLIGSTIESYKEEL
jgi:hypothetical protein